MEFPYAAESSPGAATRSGREKVAILLLALGKPLATKLLQGFDPAEVKAIMNSASALGQIEKNDLEVLVDDFAAQFARTLGLSTDFRQVRNLMEEAFAPDQLSSMLGDVPLAPGEPIWRKFQAGSENALVPYLLDEHPQTITFILSNLDPDLAARCLSMLPRGIRDSVAKRMLKLQAVSGASADILQDCMQQDLLAQSDAGAEEAGRSRVASIMNKLDREHSEAILESLMSSRPEDARKLRGMIFAFEDVAKLEQVHRLALFDKVATEQVIAALKGTDAPFKELVLSSMGARARRMVEAELQNDDGTASKEGLAARRAIADMAIAMANRGEIMLPAMDGAEQAA